jgi:hypothetical protein
MALMRTTCAVNRINFQQSACTALVQFAQRR